MILGYRATHLAQVLQKPILILCFNVALAARLDHMVAEKKLHEKVSVRNFHRWCSDQLTLYHIDRPKQSGREFFEQLVLTVIRETERGQIPRAQYGAVLIDEGHDFQAEWLKLIAQMIDPETNSLLLLYDDAQALYEKRTKREFSFAEVGIQARGRTTILKLNYRNTAEVLNVAYEFARDAISPHAAEEDGVPVLSPQSVGRHGPMPEIVQLPGYQEEVEYIAARIKKLNESGSAWSDIAVVYRSHFMGKRIAADLVRAGIPVNWLGQSNAARRYSEGESVMVLTMHASKGLEFPVVFVSGVGYMPYPRENAVGEARLLYVAMTRAMERLILTCHAESAFVTRLEEVIRKVA